MKFDFLKGRKQAQQIGLEIGTGRWQASQLREAKNALGRFLPRVAAMLAIAPCAILPKARFFRQRSYHRSPSLLIPSPETQTACRTCVCVPITGFPVTGGTRSVLAGMARTMEDTWQIEYLAQSVGPDADEHIIHSFGTPKTHPWQFPAVWLYVIAGFWKLFALLRRSPGYRILLPQDGVFTAAYTALAAKLAGVHGVRVVCIDHGNLTLLKSRAYRLERIRALHTKNWSRLRYLLARLQYLAYWPSLYLLARISARFVDHFFIPGVAGDGVEEACKRLGIPARRITRFASVIDVNRYPVLDAPEKALTRQKYGVAPDALVIAMVCRLTPEKGIDVALQALEEAISKLPSELSTRVCVVIAGDGPLRPHIEEDICRRNLSKICRLWGEIPAPDVSTLLSISDIFLYTSTRGACLSMAILEAMASGCAVVASSLPAANIYMLAEGRGLIVPPGDATQTAQALVRLLTNPDLCQRMGRLARDYVATQHSAHSFRQALLRVTGNVEEEGHE